MKIGNTTFRPGLLPQPLLQAGRLFLRTLAIKLARFLRLQWKSGPVPTTPSTTAIVDHSDQAAFSPSPQILHLIRSAERLDHVERDLIRQISSRHGVDRTTQRLLTEMRICTNRLRGQISDLERLDGPGRETVKTGDQM
jgi:hypothetical protein